MNNFKTKELDDILGMKNIPGYILDYRDDLSAYNFYAPEGSELSHYYTTNTIPWREYSIQSLNFFKFDHLHLAKSNDLSTYDLSAYISLRDPALKTKYMREICMHFLIKKDKDISPREVVLLFLYIKHLMIKVK